MNITVWLWNKTEVELRLGNERQFDAQSCPLRTLQPSWGYRPRRFTGSIPRPSVGLNHLHMLLYKHKAQV